jgi:hypothetical protein
MVADVAHVEPFQVKTSPSPLPTAIQDDELGHDTAATSWSGSI